MMITIIIMLMLIRIMMSRMMIMMNYNDYDDHDNNIPTSGPEAGLCGREPAPSLNSLLSLTLSSCPEEMFTCDR